MGSQVRHKVLFVIPTLGGGGAERVLIQLLRRMSRETFVPHLALLNKCGEFLEDVPPDVQVFDLAKRSRYSFLSLQWKINSLVRRLAADVVVTLVNYTNYMALMSRAVFKWRCPVIVCEHTSLRPSLPHQPFSSLKRLLIRGLYPKAEAIVAVSRGCKKDLIESASLPEDLIQVIYNPVDTEKLLAMAQEPFDSTEAPSPGIIAIGRLTPAKDYSTLLRAFRIVREGTEVPLAIVGEGEERAKLERISRELGVQSSVAFLGFQRNPYKYMARSKLLVLSSAWEGFPNVIPEAMACGVPVVATDCTSGPGEIIEHGVNGLLVPVGDETKLAQAILKLLRDEGMREAFAQAGRRKVEDFALERIVGEYEALIVRVVGGGTDSQ